MRLRPGRPWTSPSGTLQAEGEDRQGGSATERGAGERKTKRSRSEKTTLDAEREEKCSRVHRTDRGPHCPGRGAGARQSTLAHSR